MNAQNVVLTALLTFGIVVAQSCFADPPKSSGRVDYRQDTCEPTPSPAVDGGLCSAELGVVK